MGWIDYGQVPELKNPDIKNSRIVKNRGKEGQCSEIKYIDNKYLNSANKGYEGFAKVGRHMETGEWRIIQVRSVW
jgi:hypothetical protein